MDVPSNIRRPACWVLYLRHSELWLLVTAWYYSAVVLALLSWWLQEEAPEWGTTIDFTFHKTRSLNVVAALVEKALGLVHLGDLSATPGITVYLYSYWVTQSCKYQQRRGRRPGRRRWRVRFYLFILCAFLCRDWNYYQLCGRSWRIYSYICSI